MRIVRIRVPSTYMTGGRNPDVRYETADFELGTGPCGREVVELSMLQGANGSCEVHQMTRDRELKLFIYPVEQLTGRIEVTYNDQDLGDDIEGSASIG